MKVRWGAHGVHYLAALVFLAWLETSVNSARAEELQLPPNRFTDVLWTDGHNLVVIGDQSVLVLDAQGEPRSAGTFVRAPVEADGTGIGDDAVVVIIGREGEVARFSQGVWDLDVVPIDLDSELVGVEVTPDGVAYIAESAGIVHRWENNDWHRFTQPTEGVDIRDIVLADTPDSVFTIDSCGQVFQLSHGELSRLDFGGWSCDTGSTIQGLWYDSASHTLWALDMGRTLIGFSLESGETTSWTTPIPHPRLVTGLETDAGALLLLAGREEIVLFDGEQFFSVGERFSFPAHMHPVTPPGVVYVVGNDRSVGFEIHHPLLGTGSADPVIPTEPRREISGGARIGVGHNWHQNASLDDDTSFGMEVDAYGSFDLTPGRWRWALRPEVGYQFDNHDELGGHFFCLGFGPTLHSDALSVGYSAVFLAGKRGGSPEVGLAHGPRIEFLFDVLGLELNHRILGDGDSRHTLAARVTVEIIRLGALLFGVDRPITFEVP